MRRKSTQKCFPIHLSKGRVLFKSGYPVGVCSRWTEKNFWPLIIYQKIFRPLNFSPKIFTPLNIFCNPFSFHRLIFTSQKFTSLQHNLCKEICVCEEVKNFFTTTRLLCISHKFSNPSQFSDPLSFLVKFFRPLKLFVKYFRPLKSTPTGYPDLKKTLPLSVQKKSAESEILPTYQYKILCFLPFSIKILVTFCRLKLVPTKISADYFLPIR